MLDFRMETFLMVCRCMNFTRAAEKLHITQPAVSQHIRFLEEHYRTKLFCYSGKKLKMTSAGELLKSAAITMLHDEQSLQNQMLHSDDGFQDIRFGATMTVGDAVMSKVLERYLLHYPDAQLHMEVANTQTLLERLDNGEIDFALVEGYFNKSEYEYLHYSTERFIAVSSPHYPFRKQQDRLEDVFGERILLREPGSGTREVLERYLASQNRSIQEFAKMIEISSLPTIKELTKAGCGITFLYEVAVKEEIKKGELRRIPLTDFDVSHDFTFVWRRGSIYADMYKELFEEFS